MHGNMSALHAASIKPDPFSMERIARDSCLKREIQRQM
jgi:hypothetical protein